MDNDREAQLEKDLIRVRRELGKIRDARDQKGAEALVGKCFVYRNNCYSMPEKQSDYWPVYMKVLSPDSGGLKVIEFQTDKNGHMSIKPRTYHILRMTGYEPCTEKEFNRALAALKRRVAAL